MSKQILMIEDDSVIAGLLKHTLERRGFSVAHAADGSRAFELLNEMPAPNLVLLDVVLPFVNGFEILQQIRSTNGWESVPVIMLTSKGQEQTVVRAFENGANDYIVKPFQMEELMARIRRFIG